MCTVVRMSARATLSSPIYTAITKIKLFQSYSFLFSKKTKIVFQNHHHHQTITNKLRILLLKRLPAVTFKSTTPSFFRSLFFNFLVTIFLFCFSRSKIMNFTMSPPRKNIEKLKISSLVNHKARTQCVFHSLSAPLLAIARMFIYFFL